MEELELGIPIDPNEPRPWLVEIWVYGSSHKYPFVTREAAIEYATSRYLSDDCSVGDILAPNGDVDASAGEHAWQRYIGR
jgi:hypothetical protein